MAAEVDLPSPPAAELPAGALAPPASPETPTTVAAPAAPAAPRLSVGMRGAQVRDLQRELRRRGLRVVVDGAFGTATLRAVKAMQRRFGMSPTGVGDAAFLRRLGLRLRGVASAPAVACASTVLDVVEPPAPVVVGAPPPPILWPVRGQVSSRFGFRVYRMHEGIDIPCASDFPVASATAGTVTFAGVESDYGNLVVVRRDGGMSTAYAHLSQMAVRRGDLVGAGQLVGTVGTSGNARGSHLHFEIRLPSGPVDPLPYLEGTLPPPAVLAVPEPETEGPITP